MDVRTRPMRQVIPAILWELTLKITKGIVQGQGGVRFVQCAGKRAGRSAASNEESIARRWLPWSAHDALAFHAAYAALRTGITHQKTQRRNTGGKRK